MARKGILWVPVAIGIFFLAQILIYSFAFTKITIFSRSVTDSNIVFEGDELETYARSLQNSVRLSIAQSIYDFYLNHGGRTGEWEVWQLYNPSIEKNPNRIPDYIEDVKRDTGKYFNDFVTAHREFDESDGIEFKFSYPRADEPTATITGAKAPEGSAQPDPIEETLSGSADPISTDDDATEGEREVVDSQPRDTFDSSSMDVQDKKVSVSFVPEMTLRKNLTDFGVSEYYRVFVAEASLSTAFGGMMKMVKDDLIGQDLVGKAAVGGVDRSVDGRSVCNYDLPKGDRSTKSFLDDEKVCPGYSGGGCAVLVKNDPEVQEGLRKISEVPKPTKDSKGKTVRQPSQLELNPSARTHFIAGKIQEKFCKNVKNCNLKEHYIWQGRNLKTGACVTGNPFGSSDGSATLLDGSWAWFADDEERMAFSYIDPVVADRSQAGSSPTCSRSGASTHSTVEHCSTAGPTTCSSNGPSLPNIPMAPAPDPDDFELYNRTHGGWLSFDDLYMDFGVSGPSGGMIFRKSIDDSGKFAVNILLDGEGLEGTWTVSAVYRVKEYRPDSSPSVLDMQSLSNSFVVSKDGSGSGDPATKTAKTRFGDKEIEFTMSLDKGSYKANETVKIRGTVTRVGEGRSATKTMMSYSRDHLLCLERELDDKSTDYTFSYDDTLSVDAHIKMNCAFVQTAVCNLQRVSCRNKDTGKVEPDKWSWSRYGKMVCDFTHQADAAPTVRLQEDGFVYGFWDGSKTVPDNIKVRFNVAAGNGDLQYKVVRPQN